MKSNILIEGVSCNVLYLFYDGKVMLTGLGKKNWRGGFIPLLPKQEGLVNNYLLII